MKDDSRNDNPAIGDHQSEINYGSADNHFKKKNHSHSLLQKQITPHDTETLSTAQQLMRNKPPVTDEAQSVNDYKARRKLPDIANTRKGQKYQFLNN